MQGEKIKITAAERLANWVADQHSGQIIRRTNIPYFGHLITVATMAKPRVRLGYEIGLCHDLLEDTHLTSHELLHALLNFCYSEPDANKILACVLELTDVYTKKAYPNLSKAQRKKLESNRLLTISSTAQTVKYADLIDNINWVLIHDQKHAEKYLKKKLLLLTGLNQGDDQLRLKALELINGSLLKF